MSRGQDVSMQYSKESQHTLIPQNTLIEQSTTLNSNRTFIAKLGGYGTRALIHVYVIYDVT